MLIHIIACCFFPWSAWQSIQPMLGILGLNLVGVAVEALLDKGAGWRGMLWVAPSPLIALPGAAICAIRHSRRVQSFRFRHVLDRYGDLRRELTDARRIHEGLFPEPIEDGDVRFTYMYEPMRQIGGDYLFAHAPRKPDSTRLSVVITDVTGHGIAAALTVNRIHGELERVFAENPDVSPGDVLSLLNRYVHLTLARHSVYMTAFCLRVDPDPGTLEYASGGHPPAFVRAVNGSIEELQSTAFVLGACAADDFDPGQRTIRFTAGDALIAYTDGATEARSHDGRMLGIVGIQRLLAGSGPRYGQSWVEHLLRAVEEFRDGPPADDTLVVQIEHAGRPRKAVRTQAETPETVTS
jgi:sigma-B regulation protein RsbU (phosphoserine phosphatase)